MSAYVPFMQPQFYRPRSSVAASTLLTGLISYWNLNEASGSRADSVGGNNLTDVNTVGSTTGVVGNCADFVEANSEALTSTSGDFDFGDTTFTFAGWVWFDDLSVSFGFPFIIDRSTSGSTSQFELFVAPTGGLLFRFNGTTQASFGSGTLTTGQWYFIVASYDAAGDEISLQIDNGTAHTASLSGGILTPGAGDLTLGGRFNGTALFLDGRLDEWGAWSRLLTTQEKDDLYNSGSGTTYPFT